jgi:hypothetical protein
MDFMSYYYGTKCHFVDRGMFAVLAEPFAQYTGEWRCDHRWGWGILTFANGDVYEGEWVDDVIEGNGRYSYKDKSYYQVCVKPPVNSLHSLDERHTYCYI